MSLTIEATFDGEVFRPDEKVDLEPNTKVKVTIEEPLKLVEMPRKGKGEPYAFLRYARSLNLEGPNGFSINLDEYLYGGKSLDDAE